MSAHRSMPRLVRAWAALSLILVIAGASGAGAAAAEPAPAVANDYPTAARADYVFACMASNGQTPEMLNRCSCSIDVIATLLPYDAYVQAETILRMRQVGGEKSTLFRGVASLRHVLDDLRNAQAEAEIRCF